MANKPQRPNLVSYSFSDAVPDPGSIGVRDGDSIDQLVSNVQGINYYVDFIAFGEKSLLNTRDVAKPGLRQFVGTGIMCPNGAEMTIYQDSVTKGNLLGEKIKRGIQSAGLPAPAGVAPGILEDARDALNPFPLFSAAMGTGYPDCELKSLPVGDLNGSTGPDTGKTWIEGKVDAGVWPPRQTKWVQRLDKDDYPVWISEADFNAVPKSLNFDGTPKASLSVKEGFSVVSSTNNKLAALAILMALIAAFQTL
jgi:hypothetical protein